LGSPKIDLRPIKFVVIVKALCQTNGSAYSPAWLYVAYWAGDDTPAAFWCRVGNYPREQADESTGKAVEFAWPKRKFIDSGSKNGYIGTGLRIEFAPKYSYLYRNFCINIRNMEFPP
jgi:hypothetical protein